MPADIDQDIAGLPGADLVDQGLRDCRNEILSEYSLLVLIASPRLRHLQIEVPLLSAAIAPNLCPYEHQLYDLIQHRGGYSLYNSLLARISSFASCLERERGT